MDNQVKKRIDLARSRQAADGVSRRAELTAFADLADRSETEMPVTNGIEKRIKKMQVIHPE
jgi:hypothetical protein